MALLESIPAPYYLGCGLLSLVAAVVLVALEPRGGADAIKKRLEGGDQ